METSQSLARLMEVRELAEAAAEKHPDCELVRELVVRVLDLHDDCNALERAAQQN